MFCLENDWCVTRLDQGRYLLSERNLCMLALTRRVGEEVVIGDPKKPMGIIRVVEIQGHKVRLAFDFPREVGINRKELADQKARS